MTHPVRIPADVDREDRLLANLTARQLLVLLAAGAVVYLAWAATRSVLPLPVFAVFALPAGACATVLALGRRDGVSLDRLLLAAVRQRTAPRHLVSAPEGVPAPPGWLAARARPAGGRPPADPARLRLPARTVTPAGAVDLGADGLAVVAACSTVNFALRTPAEQESLVATFARYLHSLTAPVQVLARAERLDLTGEIADLHDRAPGLPHPALAQAAVEHAAFLGQLAAGHDLLRRQVLLVLREPLAATGPVDGLGGPSPLARLSGRRTARQDRRSGQAARRAAETRLARRLAEAADLLAPAGIVVRPLDAGQVTGVLAATCNPESLLPATAALAAPDDVVTTGGDGRFDGPWEPDAHDPDGGAWDDCPPGRDRDDEDRDDEDRDDEDRDDEDRDEPRGRRPAAGWTPDTTAYQPGWDDDL